MFEYHFLRYTALPNYSPSPVSEPYKESNTIRQSIYNPPPLINKRGGLIKYFLGTGGPFVKHLLVNITPNQYFPKIVKKHCEKQQKLSATSKNIANNSKNEHHHPKSLQIAAKMKAALQKPCK